MTPEFEMYIWSGMERFKCPPPCLRNFETEAECLSCWQGCRNHPKPKPPKVVERVSPIVSGKGQPITVVEIEEPEESIDDPAGFAALPDSYVRIGDEVKPLSDFTPKRFKRQDADATGEP